MSELKEKVNKFAEQMNDADANPIELVATSTAIIANIDNGVVPTADDLEAIFNDDNLAGAMLASLLVVSMQSLQA